MASGDALRAEDLRYCAGRVAGLIEAQGFFAFDLLLLYLKF